MGILLEGGNRPQHTREHGMRAMQAVSVKTVATAREISYGLDPGEARTAGSDSAPGPQYALGGSYVSIDGPIETYGSYISGAGNTLTAGCYTSAPCARGAGSYVFVDSQYSKPLPGN